MAAYIKSNLNAKMLASPAFIQPTTKEYLDIMDQLDILDQRIDNLRGIVPSIEYRYGKGEKINELRELRKKASYLEKRAKQIEKDFNPEWYKYWGIEND